MFGTLENGVGQPPTELPAAITPRRLAVVVTIAGAVAVMVLHVLYAVVIQGWGAPLP